MNILVSPKVGEIDFARVGLNISEGVEDVSADQVRNPHEWLSYRNRREIINWDERRREFSAINSPMCISTRCNFVQSEEEIYQLTKLNAFRELKGNVKSTEDDTHYPTLYFPLLATVLFDSMTFRVFCGTEGN